MGDTLYGVLGVEPDAERATIVSAYREKVKTTHPDVNDAPDASEAFKRVRTARRVLADRDERARYDRLGHETYVRRHLDSGRWEVSGSSKTDGSVSEAARTMSATTTPTATTTTPSRGRADGYGTAAGYYSPGERVGTSESRGFGRTVDAIREVAPLLLAHFVLLGTALIVGAMVLLSGSGGGVPSVTSAVVATAMVGITVCLSLLHVTSTLYR